MHEIVKRDLPIRREVWNRDEAIRVFGEIGEDYKVEIIDDIIPEGEDRSRCIARANGSMCAAVRTCRAPASWARVSS